MFDDTRLFDDVELASADSFIDAIWSEYLRPPADTTVTEWAEANRVLSAKDSSEPGRYRVARTPYALEPMNCLSARSSVEEVVLVWGAQTSKSTIGLNWLGYTVDANPGPLMLVQPTIDLAKRFGRQRLMPMIDESKALRRKFRENRSRDEANTQLMKEFAGGVMVIAGANSAAGLRSMPVRDLFLDEVDGYPLDVDGEGDPVGLAAARQTTFARRKTLTTSTPTTKGFSRIEAAYLASDQCRYEVACPHCDEFQALEWGADTAWGVKWDRDPETGDPDPASVRYVCRHNGCIIKEHHKTTMLAGGRWVARKPGAQGGRVRGFHLSALYSPLGWASWARLVREWADAMAAVRTGDTSKLRAFVNTRLAETYEDQGDKADHHALRRRAPDIPLRVVHWGMFVMTAGVDVQGDRLEIALWAWGRGMERQLVDVNVFYGDPALPESDDGSPWKALTEYRRTPVLHRSGKPVPLLACMIDSGGHHTQAVYAYARAHMGANVRAVKGMSVAGKPVIGKPTDQDVSWRGKKLRKGVKLWPVGSDTGKDEIYGRLRNETPGPGYVHLSMHLSDQVFEQLTSERRVAKYVKGRPRLEWVLPPGRRNEQLDMAVYALAGAHAAGIERWREGDWRKWQHRVEAKDLFDAPPEQEPEQEALPVDAADATIPDVAAQQEPAETIPEAAATTARPPKPAVAPRRSGFVQRFRK